MSGAEGASSSGASGLVTVVVPVHNGEQHLAQTLRAVAAQSHPRVELIVVDDESTDGSVAVATTCNVPLRLIQQRNAGVSAARNAGLAAARGEFITFVDQDDIWHPDHLARQLAVFAGSPALCAVVSPYQHWPLCEQADPAPAALFGAPHDGVDPDFTGWVYHQFLLDCWALTSATLLRRDAVRAANGFDESLPFSEDWDLWLRLSLQGQFAKLCWPPVLYRHHAVQGSRRVRKVDYRCRLLLANAARHGLASRDGRSIDRKVFARTIARYEAEFGYQHLCNGDRRVALRSLWRAWRRRPTALRVLAQAAAGTLGWRPRGHDKRLGTS